MKLMSLEEIRQWIGEQQYFPAKDGYSLTTIISREEFDSARLSDSYFSWYEFEEEYMKEYSGYLVPASLKYCLPYLNHNEKEQEIWKTWHVTYQDFCVEEEKQVNFSLTPEYSNLKDRLDSINIKLLQDYYADKMCANLALPEFWQYIRFCQSSYHLKKWALKQYVEKLAVFFENVEDVSLFQKTLPLYVKQRGGMDVQYHLYLKLLQDLVPDYTLSGLPPILLKRLGNSKAENLQLEVIKAFRKYNFNEIKDHVLNIFNHSNKPKAVELCRQILLDNNYIEKEITTPLIVKENHTITYHCHVLCDFKQLKLKAHDTLFLIQNLLELIEASLTMDYPTSKITYSIVEHDLHFWHEDESEILTHSFRARLEDYLSQTFSEDYLTPERSKFFSQGLRGERVRHETNHETVQEFHQYMKSAMLNEKLEEMLTVKEEKSGRTKI